MGCVDPVGEAGGDIARMGALAAGFGDTVPGVQINRFCASGLDSVNFAAAQVMSGQHDLTIGGGVESMSRVGIGASGGAWSADPAVAYANYFTPQGIGADLIATLFDGYSRTDIDRYALEEPAPRRRIVGRFKGAIGRSRTSSGSRCSATTSTCGRRRQQTLARLKPAFTGLEQAGFDAVAIQEYPQVERSTTSIRRQLRHRRDAAAVLIGTSRQARRRASGPEPESAPSPRSAASRRSC